jgi:hypothetical protein
MNIVFSASSEAALNGCTIRYSHPGNGDIPGDPGLWRTSSRTALANYFENILALVPVSLLMEVD